MVVPTYLQPPPHHSLPSIVLERYHSTSYVCVTDDIEPDQPCVNAAPSSRVPLVYKIHCVQESLPRTWIQHTFKSAKIDKTSLEDEHDTEADYSGSFGATNSAPQQLGPTPPGTWYSPTVTAKERKFTGSNATFAAVPTYNPNTLLNWSDVVAFGSEAIQPPATTKRLEADVPHSILVTIITNKDILNALMPNCPDFPTRSLLSLHVRQLSVLLSAILKASSRRC